MPFELISIKGLWPFLARIPWLAAILCRWYFTAQRLAALVYVDIYPRHESVRVDVGPVATFDVHVQLMNLTPFELELDRARFKFWCAGIRLDAIILDKQKIAPGASVSLFLSDSIPDGAAVQIAKFHKTNQSTLDGNIEFNCRVRSFAKQVPSLSGIRPLVVNEAARLPKEERAEA